MPTSKVRFILILQANFCNPKCRWILPCRRGIFISMRLSISGLPFSALPKVSNHSARFETHHCHCQSPIIRQIGPDLQTGNLGERELQQKKLLSYIKGWNSPLNVWDTQQGNTHLISYALLTSAKRYETLSIWSNLRNSLIFFWYLLLWAFVFKISLLPLAAPFNIVMSSVFWTFWYKAEYHLA